MDSNSVNLNIRAVATRMSNRKVESNRVQWEGLNLDSPGMKPSRRDNGL